MPKLSYPEKLRDPRWQRKRLEIMNRDGFRCRDCGDDKSTLNVHHAFYENGKEPWEYEECDLATLCRPCHESRHDLTNDVLIALNQCSYEDALAVAGFAKMMSGSNSVGILGSDDEIIGACMWAGAICTRNDWSRIYDGYQKIKSVLPRRQLSIADYQMIFERIATARGEVFVGKETEPRDR